MLFDNIIIIDHDKYDYNLYFLSIHNKVYVYFYNINLVKFFI